jgi:hypothetical protein
MNVFAINTFNQDIIMLLEISVVINPCKDGCWHRQCIALPVSSGDCLGVLSTAIATGVLQHYRLQLKVFDYICTRFS